MPNFNDGTIWQCISTVCLVFVIEFEAHFRSNVSDRTIIFGLNAENSVDLVLHQDYCCMSANLVHTNQPDVILNRIEMCDTMGES